MVGGSQATVILLLDTLQYWLFPHDTLSSMHFATRHNKIMIKYIKNAHIQITKKKQILDVDSHS